MPKEDNCCSKGVDPKTGLPLLDEESELLFQPRHGLIYWIVFGPVTFLSRIIFWAKIDGRDNIPKSGGCVIAFNHICNLDGVMIVASAKRRLFFLAKIELSRGLKGKIMKGMGIIPVDRARRNSAAVEMGVEILKQGGVVAIAPEGHTNRKAELAPFKFGAVAMAGRANAPIVPVAIVGRYIPFSRKLSISYGKPMKVDVNRLEDSNEKLWYTINSMREKMRKEQ